FLEPVDGLVPVVGDLLVATGMGDANGADGYEGDEKSHRGTSGDSASYRARDAFTSAFGPVTGDHDGQMRQSEDDRKADERVELVDVAEGGERSVEQVAHHFGEGAGQVAGVARHDDRGAHQQGGDEE